MKPQPHEKPTEAVFELDLTKWITSQEYNDQLREQHVINCRKVGQELGRKREELLVEYLRSKK